jgi:HPt (histidine-containing phosphotransfer) domain-containing protein
MSSVFDENALMDRLDGDVEFLEETIAMLHDDSPALLEQIAAAAESADAAALTKAAHALKGMLSNFCAEPAETAARELEMMGRNEQLAEVHSATARVRQETERLRDALSAFLRTKTG